MDGKIHNRICKTLLGDDCKNVNFVLDYPVRWLGKRHRILFHDVITAPILGAIVDNKNPVRGACAGLLHVAIDRIGDVK